MRRHLGVVLALALASVGCGGKNTNFDQSATGGGAAGGTTASATNGNTSAGTSGTTGSIGGLDCSQEPANTLKVEFTAQSQMQGGTQKMPLGTTRYTNPLGPLETDRDTANQPTEIQISGYQSGDPDGGTMTVIFDNGDGGINDPIVPNLDIGGFADPIVNLTLLYYSPVPLPTSPNGDTYKCQPIPVTVGHGDYEFSSLQVDGSGVTLSSAAQFHMVCRSRDQAALYDGDYDVKGCFTYGSGATPDGGAPDAGPCGDLTGATLNLALNPSSLNLSSTAALIIGGQYANGFNAALCPVTVVEQPNEGLLAIQDNSLVLDSSGTATTSLDSRTTPGQAHVTVTLGPTSKTLTIPVGSVSSTDAGPPTPTSIAWESTTPGSGRLSVIGSGQTHGSMTFLVTDQFGQPVPSVQVDFTQDSQNLLSLSSSSGQTATDGTAVVSFDAQATIGVATVTATVNPPAAPIAISTSHTLSVHAGKPSASHFTLYCDKTNIPVYTTTAQVETVSCHVSLADRFGNPIDQPVTVSFAAEAGKIDSNAVVDGGNADLTFTTILSPGFTPIDVPPLAADATQFPVPLANDEPQLPQGALVINPRDQFVTIIAYTQGEEAFTDQNNNGVFDVGGQETFVDLGDPYIDANDNNVYDSSLPFGQGSETKVGSIQNGNDGGYHYGNGVWDADATIWTAFHLVFTGTATLTTEPTDQVSAADVYPVCVVDQSFSTVRLYAYDAHLNFPGLDTKFQGTLQGSGATLTTTGLAAPADNEGTSVIDESKRGIYLVAEADGGACVASNGQACIQKFLFTGFRTSAVGTATLTDTNTQGGSCLPIGVDAHVDGPHNTTTDTNLSTSAQP